MCVLKKLLSKASEVKKGAVTESKVSYLTVTIDPDGGRRRERWKGVFRLVYNVGAREKRKPKWGSGGGQGEA